jgi:hypothetical protein
MCRDLQLKQGVSKNKLGEEWLSIKCELIINFSW